MGHGELGGGLFEDRVELGLERLGQVTVPEEGERVDKPQLAVGLGRGTDRRVAEVEGEGVTGAGPLRSGNVPFQGFVVNHAVPL